MKVLCIGNSFSEDANRYTKRLAESACADFEVLNLYIGGCPLESHAKNIMENNRAYMPQRNGHNYEEYLTSIEEAFAYRDWDYVTIQQVSGLSGKYETFLPYADVIVNKIRECCPMAKLLVHETWAYEYGCTLEGFKEYGRDPEIMTERLMEAYARLKDHVNAAGIIPSGRVIAALKRLPEFNVNAGGESLHRDTFHLSHTYGRFTAAAVWMQYLGVCDVDDFDALPDGEDLDPHKIALIKKTVKEMVTPLK